jgi:hypothetical protein
VKLLCPFIGNKNGTSVFVINIDWRVISKMKGRTEELRDCGCFSFSFFKLFFQLNFINAAEFSRKK